MAELDPDSVTLQDVLDNYNDDPDRLSKKTGKMPKKRTLGPLLKDYADKPLLDLFTPDENGDVPARQGDQIKNQFRNRSLLSWLSVHERLH